MFVNGLVLLFDLTYKALMRAFWYTSFSSGQDHWGQRRSITPSDTIAWVAGKQISYVLPDQVRYLSPKVIYNKVIRV